VTDPRHRRVAFALLVCSIAVTAARCTRPSAQPDSHAAPPTATAPATSWTREALELQQRMVELQQRTPRESGAAPATTPWMAAASADAAGKALKAATPGGLLIAVVGSSGWADPLGDGVWEQTLRVWTDGDAAAVGVVLLWDFTDDAVAGHDFRISMQRTAADWTVQRIEERYHCRRKSGVDGRCG
jgi:hypothetical protein